MTMADVLAWAPHVLTAGALIFAWGSRRADRKRDGEKRAEDQKRDDGRRDEEDRRWKAEREHEAERLKRETDGVLRSLEIEHAKLRSEAERWRLEKRDTKRAEVAGEVIVALGDYLRQLERMTIPDDETSMYGDPEHIESTWGGFRVHADALRRLRGLSAAYLPDDALALCERIRAVEDEIYDAQMRAHGPDSDAHCETGFGDGTRERLRALEADVRHVLRPYAWLEPGAPSAESAKPSASRPAPRMRVAETATTVVEVEVSEGPGRAPGRLSR